MYISGAGWGTYLVEFIVFALIAMVVALVVVWLWRKEQRGGPTSAKSTPRPSTDRTTGDGKIDN